MSGIMTAIRLNDMMSAPLYNISNALNTTISAFETFQSDMNASYSTASFDSARASLAQANMELDRMQSNIQENTNQQQQFNTTAQKGTGIFSNLGSQIKSMVGMYLGLQGVRMGIDFFNDSIEACNAQISAETKLKTVMQERMGASNSVINSVKQLASEQQQLGVIGDEVQLSGAQQLSTFLNTSDSLRTLLPAMNNLAAQQNGVNATSEDMVSIGNLMGKAMQGQTSALTRVGITFDETQEKVLKYGTEQERAAILSQVITDNVGAMNAVLARTPEGQIQQLSNSWGDIKEQIGSNIYPAVLDLFSTINANMPTITSMIEGVSIAVSGVINVVNFLISSVMDVFNAVGGVTSNIMNSWSSLSPAILFVATCIGVVTAAMLAWKVCTMIYTGAQMLMNASLFACPLVWVVLAIVAIIGAIYLVIGAWNKWTGDSISATGVVVGVLMTAVAAVWNTFLGLLDLILGLINNSANSFIMFANFLGNLFNDPIGAIVHLFGDMADSVLGILETIARAMDKLFGSSMADTVSGWRSGLDSMVESVANDYGNGTYEKVAQELNLSSDSLGLKRWSYSDAYSTGYDWGVGIEDGIKNFNPSSLLNGLTDPNKGVGSANRSQYNPDDLSDTANNTKNTADALTSTKEDLKYLRDIAERDIINRFTTAEIKVDMVNNNNISSEMDIDGVSERLFTRIYEEANAVAEGVH